VEVVIHQPNRKVASSSARESCTVAQKYGCVGGRVRLGWRAIRTGSESNPSAKEASMARKVLCDPRSAAGDGSGLAI
jgi:hypothetical protein